MGQFSKQHLPVSKIKIVSKKFDVQGQKRVKNHPRKKAEQLKIR